MIQAVGTLKEIQVRRYLDAGTDDAACLMVSCGVEVVTGAVLLVESAVMKSEDLLRIESGAGCFAHVEGLWRLRWRSVGGSRSELGLWLRVVDSACPARVKKRPRRNRGARQCACTNRRKGKLDCSVVGKC